MNYNIKNLIEKKNSGKFLLKKEIEFFVNGSCNHAFAENEVVDLLRAIYNNKMSFNEVFNLTISMANSGKKIEISKQIGKYVDKHSTGGVSDSTSLILMPILAVCGVKFVKISGRSLGFTGGTADKLEVFNGYNTSMKLNNFVKVVKKTNAGIVTQTDDFVPSDKIFYSLRNKYNLTNSIPLVASSIMSKKLAFDSSLIVLDVKCGSGAFFKDKKDALLLAKTMVKIGKKAGRQIYAVVTEMSQPLTDYIGNNFEVLSVLDTLDNKPSRLKDLSFFLATKILVLCGKVKNELQGEMLVNSAIKNGLAKNKLKQIVELMGGSTKIFENKNVLKTAKKQIDVKCETDGYVVKIDCEKLGNVVNLLCVKNKIFSKQDEVGLKLHTKLGEFLQKGQNLISIFYNECDNIDVQIKNVLNAFTLSKNKDDLKSVKNKKLIIKVIE